MEGLTILQQKIIEEIRQHSRQDAISGAKLAMAAGLKERPGGKFGADIRSIVNAVRVKGYPVCANGVGYWWPKDEFELSKYVVDFQRRIDKQQEAVDGMKKGFDRIEKVEPRTKIVFEQVNGNTVRAVRVPT